MKNGSKQLKIFLKKETIAKLNFLQLISIIGGNGDIKTGPPPQPDSTLSASHASGKTTIATTYC